MNHDCHTFSCSSRLSHWHKLQCRWLEDCWKHRHLKSVQKPATSSLQAFPNKIQNAKSLDPFQVTAHTPPPVLYMYIGAWRFPDLRKLLSGMSPKFQVISHWSLQSQLWTPFLRRSWFWWWGVPVEYLNNFGWKLVWLLKSSKIVVVGSHKKKVTCQNVKFRICSCARNGSTSRWTTLQQSLYVSIFKVVARNACVHCLKKESSQTWKKSQLSQTKHW